MRDYRPSLIDFIEKYPRIRIDKTNIFSHLLYDLEYFKFEQQDINDLLELIIDKLEGYEYKKHITNVIVGIIEIISLIMAHNLIKDQNIINSLLRAFPNILHIPDLDIISYQTLDYIINNLMNKTNE
jgi:hypothetical protein